MFRITVYDENPKVEPDVFTSGSAPRLVAGSLFIDDFVIGEGEMTEEDFDFVEVS